MRTGCARLLSLLLAVTAFSGCFRNSAPPQFYMLSAVETLPAGPAPSDGFEGLVGLGPVRVPAYLDRDQIVTAVSGQEYRLADDHRWAERLDVTLLRVSAENLSRLVPGARILMHPWPRDPKPDVQVAIDLQDLYVDPVGIAHFDASWTLRSGQRSDVHAFTCRLPASATDYTRMVDAQSQCLARLNRAVADAIRNSPGLR